MQGFNMGRYYPPPESSSPAPFNKSHPLGARARKLKTQGILTVRFEMPFAIWCSSCPKPTIVGQGVRFNAEKKKVGNYHSTPIWSFRMKHAVCGGWIEIRTDPKASEYVVVEGAQRRDYGEERAEKEDDGVVIDEKERARRREDAMAGLEGKKDEEAVKKDAGKRIGELLEDREKWWSDPYAASKMVRKGFRRERKERHREAEKSEGIKAKLGLDVELLPETEEDRRRAKLIDFGPMRNVDATSKPLFQARGSIPQGKQSTTTRAERARIAMRHDLEQRLVSGTRAMQDPFTSAQGTRLERAPRTSSIQGRRPGAKEAPATSALVAYDSD